MQTPDSISPVDSPPPNAQPWPSVPVENPGWNLLDVLAVAAFAFLAFFIAVAVVLGIVHALPRFHNVNPTDLVQTAVILVPTQTFAYLLVVGFMVQIVRLKGGGKFLRAISWKEPRLVTAVLAAGGGAALALFSSVFTALLSRWVPKSLPIEKLFRDTNSAYLLALFGIVVAPFVEEIFFRGLLYPALARRIGVGSSVVFTAALFAVIHQAQLAHAWVPLAWLFIVGLALTIVRAQTKSVATCVLIHMAYNTTLFSLFFVDTHGFRQL